MTLVGINPRAINQWKSDSLLAVRYGCMLGTLLEVSSKNDRSQTLKSFIDSIARDPVRKLAFISIADSLKQELIAFCYAEIHQAQLEFSATTPENTESSRFEIYQQSCRMKEKFERLDRIVIALN